MAQGAMTSTPDSIGHAQAQPPRGAQLLQSQPLQPTADGSPASMAASDSPNPLTAELRASTCSAGSAHRLEAPRGRALFVQGLAQSVEFPDLYRVFSRFGTVVSCRVLHDAKRGASRGIGYVNFADANEADRALRELTDKDRAQLGAPTSPASDSLDASREASTAAPTALSVKLADHDPNFTEADAKALSVHFIPPGTTLPVVREAFAQFGAVIACELCPAAASKQTPPKSAPAAQLAAPGLCARIEFTDASAATAASAALHRSTLFGSGSPLYIKPAEPEAKIRAREERKAQERDRRRSSVSVLPAFPGSRQLPAPGPHHQQHHQQPVVVQLPQHHQQPHHGFVFQQPHQQPQQQIPSVMLPPAFAYPQQQQPQQQQQQQQEQFVLLPSGEVVPLSSLRLQNLQGPPQPQPQPQQQHNVAQVDPRQPPSAPLYHPGSTQPQQQPQQQGQQQQPLWAPQPAPGQPAASYIAPGGSPAYQVNPFQPGLAR